MNPIATASNKRFAALIAAFVFPILKAKLGVEVEVETQHLLIEAAMLYVFGSHTKEAVVERAKAAGAKAAESVTSVNDAAAALADPVKP